MRRSYVVIGPAASRYDSQKYDARIPLEALLPGAKLRLPVGGEERTERGCTILRVNWEKAYILVEYFAGKRMKETFKIAVEE